MTRDEAPPATTPGKSTASYWPPSTRQIVGGVIVIAALLFVVQDRSTGHVEILFFDFTAPRWIWILTVFGLGVATGLLFARRRSQSHT